MDEPITKPDTPKALGRVLLFHMERLVGCCPEILSFARWWRERGPFPITIPRDGGLRTSEARQFELCQLGASRASQLKDTAHGRGAAIDVMPVRTTAQTTGLPLTCWTCKEPSPGERAEAIRLYREFGALAEGHGLEWGGKWPGIVDLGHAQVPRWRDLPIPVPLETRNG